TPSITPFLDPSVIPPSCLGALHGGNSAPPGQSWSLQLCPPQPYPPALPVAVSSMILPGGPFLSQISPFSEYYHQPGYCPPAADLLRCASSMFVGPVSAPFEPLPTSPRLLGGLARGTSDPSSFSCPAVTRDTFRK